MRNTCLDLFKFKKKKADGTLLPSYRDVTITKAAEQSLNSLHALLDK